MSKMRTFFVNPIYLSNQSMERFYDTYYSSDATLIPDIEEIELMKQRNFRGGSKDYNDRLVIIRKLVEGNKLMEFGCSWGYFLFQSKAYDFTSIGVEISSKRAEFGRNYLAVNIFSDIDSIHEKFDIICSFHTLEHLVDLTDIFDKFYEALLPSGSLIIEVPNFDPETKGKTVYSMIGKVHPLGFSKKFFETNLLKHGFPEIDIASNYADLLKKQEDREPLKDIIVIYAKKNKRVF